MAVLRTEAILLSPWTGAILIRVNPNSPAQHKPPGTSRLGRVAGRPASPARAPAPDGRGWCRPRWRRARPRCALRSHTAPGTPGSLRWNFYFFQVAWDGILFFPDSLRWNSFFNFVLKGDFFWFFLYMYVIKQHCFISAAPQIPLCRRMLGSNPKEGVLKKLSLSGLAKLSWLRYLTKVWFGLSRLSWTWSPR